MVLNLAKAVNPLPRGLAQRAEHFSIFCDSTGAVDFFFLFFRKLVGSFFGWKLVGVVSVGMRLRVRTDWKPDGVIAISWRQGRADCLFEIFLLLSRKVAVEVLLLHLLAIARPIWPSAIVAELVTTQASAKKEKFSLHHRGGRLLCRVN
jgi:hypothetical protein